MAQPTETPQAAPATAAQDVTASEPGAKHFKPMHADYGFLGGAQSFEDFDRWRKSAEQEEHVSELSQVFQRLIDNIMHDGMMSMADKAQAVQRAASDLAARVDVEDAERLEGGERSLVGRVGGWLADRVAPRKAKALDPFEAGAFVAFKDASGAPRWFAIWSNHFEDREGELFPAQAHKEFIAWADEQPASRMPELWFWHMPLRVDDKGMPHGMGRADWLDFTDEGFTAASGDFEDWAIDRRLPERLEAMGPLAVSHGYVYPRKERQAGVYGRYRAFEISPLPPASAANELTAFVAGKEGPMFTDAKRAQLVALLGDEGEVKGLETSLQKMATEAQSKGLNFKELVESLTEPQANDEPDPQQTQAPAAGAGEAAEAAEGAEGAKAADAITAEGIAAALKAAIAPLTSRLDQLEAGQRQLSEMYQPRAQPFIASQEGAKADGRAADVKAAMAAAEDGGAPEGVPDHMRFYFERAGGQPVGQ